MSDRGPPVLIDPYSERRLVKEIEEIWDDSDSTYGSPRVTVELRRQGRCVNHKRVERLMRIHDIVVRHSHLLGVRICRLEPPRDLEW